jgi:hypothetical protein
LVVYDIMGLAIVWWIRGFISRDMKERNIFNICAKEVLFGDAILVAFGDVFED